MKQYRRYRFFIILGRDDFADRHPRIKTVGLGVVAKDPHEIAKFADFLIFGSEIEVGRFVGGTEAL
jgi:hypothetical protein